MAATVDYLFGYDATAHVMADWMYEQLTESYVLDPENRKFMSESNPWALHGMARAVARGRRTRHGPNRRRTPSRACARCCSRPKATSRPDPTPANVRVCTRHAVPTRTKADARRGAMCHWTVTVGGMALTFDDIAGSGTSC